MASVSRMKMLGKAAVRATTTTTKPNLAGAEFGAAVRAHLGKWMKWPLKESVKETDVGVYGEEHNLACVDWDRIILFPGRWYFPPVTVKPKFEFWKYSSLKSEPLTDVLTEPKARNIFRMRNLFCVAGGVLVIGGIVYYVRRQQRKRFTAYTIREAAAVHKALVQALNGAPVRGAIGQAVQRASMQAVRDAAAQAIQDAVAQAVQGAVVGQAVQEAVGQPVQDAIGLALQNANVDAPGALVQAFQGAEVKDAIGQAVWDAIVSVRTSNVTTGDVTQARLDAIGGQEMTLQTFLDTFGLVASLPAPESGELTVKDLLTSSVKDLVESGIPEDYAVKLKKAVFCLLGYPFALA